LEEWCSDGGPVTGFSYSKFDYWLHTLETQFVEEFGLSKRQEALIQLDLEFRLKIASGVKGSLIHRCLVAGAVLAKTRLPPSLDHCRTAVRFLSAAGYERLKGPPKSAEQVS
jgi:hypothetical protein